MKNTIVNRFGLIALMLLSLFASTAFAGNTPAATQVVVTNTPAQPVPMVGLIKNSDAPARNSLQTLFLSLNPNTIWKVVSVPVNQRLVIEQVSGRCNIVGNGWITLSAVDPSTNNYKGAQFLPDQILHSATSAPITFYADPGSDLILNYVDGGNGAQCSVSLTGYYVSLP
jgi:hypothetical protein